MHEAATEEQINAMYTAAVGMETPRYRRSSAGLLAKPDRRGVLYGPAGRNALRSSV